MEEIIKEAEAYFETTDTYKNYKDSQSSYLEAARYGVVTFKLAARIESLEKQLELLTSFTKEI